MVGSFEGIAEGIAEDFAEGAEDFAEDTEKGAAVAQPAEGRCDRPCCGRSPGKVGGAKKLMRDVEGGAVVKRMTVGALSRALGRAVESM